MGRTDGQTDGQTDGVTALLDLLSPSATQVKNAQNGRIPITYRITTGGGMDDRQKLIISGDIKRFFEISKSDS